MQVQEGNPNVMTDTQFIAILQMVVEIADTKETAQEVKEALERIIDKREKKQ